MKKFNQIFKLSFVQFSIVLCSIVILAYGCAFTKSMLSKGRKHFNLANAALAKKEYRIAIKHAADAVVVDEKIPRFQKFIYTHFATMKQTTDQFLNSSKNTKNIADAEKRYKVYFELVDMYAALSKLKFPLEDKKKGEWKFSTEIIDYSKKLEASRLYAYNLLFKEGKANVKKGNIDKADKNFRRAYDFYANATEKAKSAENITKSYFNYCKRNKKSKSIEISINVHNAYNYILYYLPQNSLASEGKHNMKTKISALYLTKGIKLFAQRSLKKKISAVDFFKKAIQWNANNEKAVKALENAKNSIAEIYYTKANKMLKSSKANKQLIIQTYRLAQKWVPNYKDSMYKIYSIKVSGELKELRKNLAYTKKEYKKLSKRINPISKSVNTCDDALNNLTWVSDNLRNVDSRMKTIATTLKTFSPIPTVGTVTNITGRLVEKSRKPVHNMVLKFNKIEKPIIDPTKASVAKVKGVVDKIKGMMTTTGDVIEKTEVAVAEIDSCIVALKAEKQFMKVEKAVKEMNKGVKGTAKELANINKTLDSFEYTVKQIARIASPVNKIKSGISKVKPALDKIGNIASKIDKALSKKITIGKWKFKKTFSVKGALKAAKPFQILADKILKPILKRIKIPVPKIPGVQDLKNKVASVEQKYRSVIEKANKIKQTYSKYTNYENILKNNLNKFIETTGCGTKVGVRAYANKY